MCRCHLCCVVAPCSLYSITWGRTCVSRSLSFSDAQHLLLLLRRLGDLYRGAPFAEASPLSGSVGHVSYDHILEACADPKSGLIPANWQPEALNETLTLRQWAALPRAIWDLAARPQSVHLIYLPQPALVALKQTANRLSNASSASPSVSTLDAVSALVSVVTNSLLQRPLVPLAPKLLTVNTELLHPGLPKDLLRGTESLVSNTVGILQVHGLKKGA